MRLLPALAAAALVAAPAAPLAAQAAGQNADPDKNASGGVQVAGWTAHFDRAGANAQQVKFVRMAKGYHVTAGPSGIYYNPSTTASGNYQAAATFTQTKAAAHPEAYGLFVGGQQLGDSSASYLYYVVRQDGKYLVRHRAGPGAGDLHTLVEWTANPAVKAAGADGKATNALAIRVAADSVRFLANGTQVAAVSRQQAGDLSGVAGLRVNHNLDVHVDGFAVSRGGGARAAGAARRSR